MKRRDVHPALMYAPPTLLCIGLFGFSAWLFYLAASTTSLTSVALYGFGFAVAAGLAALVVDLVRHVRRGDR